VRRVGDLAVERHHVAADAAERGQRLAVGLARGDLVAELVGRQLPAGRVEAVRRAPGRLGEPDRQVALAAQLPDRLLGVVERLAVLAGLVLDRLDALAFLVRATIAVGRPSVASASAKAASIASTSWPSMEIACQPNASIRRT
jgi:hypothetical protein